MHVSNANCSICYQTTISFRLLTRMVLRANHPASTCSTKIMAIPFPNFQANPIVVREGRARWRGSRAFWIALAYALILASIMWYSYNDMSSSGRYNYGADEFSVAAQRGHELFTLLSLLQTGIWLLVAPALTATSIAVERESGLLSAMLLSKMTPGQIVRGKLLSALSFLLLLIVVALPITAICFLMGGVSQGEFIGALLIQLATAFCGAVIGLAASAFQKRAAPAMGMTFGFIVFWIGSSAVMFTVVSSGPLMRSAPGLWSWLQPFLEWYGWTNPLLAMLSLVEPRSGTSSYPGHFVMPDWWQGWHYTVVTLLLFSALRLWQTARILRRSPDLEETEKAPKERRFFKNRAAKVQTTPVAKRDERWRVPLATNIVFGDAAMRRELAARWKIRRAAPRVLWAFALPVAYGFYWYLRALIWLLRNPDDRPEVFVAVSMTLLLGWVLCSVLMSAGTISRERETGTWNGLRLTLLSERSILTAKIIAPVVACVVYSLPFLPLIVFCWPEQLGIVHHHESDAGLVQWFLALALLLVVALECSCLGVWWSQRAKSTATATGAALATLCIVWIVLPILASALLQYPGSRSFEDAASYWHPFVGLVELLRQPQHYSYNDGAIAQTSILLKQSFALMMLWHLGVAATFFALTLRRFRRANHLERD